MTKKYYQILGISETATQAEIKKAYVKLVLECHPDKIAQSGLTKAEAERKTKELNEAYSILSKENLRKRYDNGETNFSESYSDEFSEDKAKVDSLNEQINLMKEMINNEEERATLMSRLIVLSTISDEVLTEPVIDTKKYLASYEPPTIADGIKYSMGKLFLEKVVV